MKLILFPHFTEIFTIIKLMGFMPHASWWWMAVFIAHDGITGLAAMGYLEKTLVTDSKN